jgi:uncharacterized protein with ParB-like and HNH nuclease domain
MATMNFNTANSTFRQLLGNGLSYRVPPFQRDYSWTEDEWDDLWQDILGLSNPDGEPAHYMGYLVLQSSDNKFFDIIDGQQRLTTLSVMILAALGHLRDLTAFNLDAEDNAKREEQLRNSYIGYLDPVTLTPRSKLALNRHNDRFYQTYLVPLESLPSRGLNASERQLRKAFFWFGERIEKHCGTTAQSGKDLAAFLDGLVDKLFFTVITVADELNAFKVFETLNARGVRLSATDLLKNYLFSIVNAQAPHETRLKELEDRWENVVNLLGSESFPEFLRVYWNSKNKLVRKSDLFKAVRKQITTAQSAFELLRFLDRSAEIYAALHDSRDSFWNSEEKKVIEQLSMYNVRQPTAMLMACRVRFSERDRSAFTRIMKAVAVISFRYNVICNSQANEQEQLYNGIARKVSDGVYAKPADALAALKEIYPDDDTFKAAFSAKELRTNSSSNKKIARYILFNIERQQSGQDLDLESDKYSLEHILPEHPSEEWADIEEAHQESLIYRLGNMTLLETASNRDLGNRGYLFKREIYRQSVFQITRAIAEHYEIWDESKIETRQRQMASVASGVWKVDFGD